MMKNILISLVMFSLTACGLFSGGSGKGKKDDDKGLKSQYEIDSSQAEISMLENSFKVIELQILKVDCPDYEDSEQSAIQENIEANYQALINEASYPKVQFKPDTSAKKKGKCQLGQSDGINFMQSLNEESKVVSDECTYGAIKKNNDIGIFYTQESQYQFKPSDLLFEFSGDDKEQKTCEATTDVSLDMSFLPTTQRGYLTLSYELPKFDLDKCISKSQWKEIGTMFGTKESVARKVIETTMGMGCKIKADFIVTTVESPETSPSLQELQDEYEDCRDSGQSHAECDDDLCSSFPDDSLCMPIQINDCVEKPFQEKCMSAVLANANYWITSIEDAVRYDEEFKKTDLNCDGVPGLRGDHVVREQLDGFLSLCKKSAECTTALPEAIADIMMAEETYDLCAEDVLGEINLY